MGKLRDGQKDLCTLLLVIDVIFIEPRTGLRPDVRVFFGASICRRLLIDDSLNHDGLGCEREWEFPLILLRYEANVDSLPTTLPGAKICGAWEVRKVPVPQLRNRTTHVRKVQIRR